MNSDNNKKVSDIIQAIGERDSSLSVRISNLEQAEYSSLNFYGSMYQFNLGTVIAIASAGTYYTVTGMVTGLVKGFAFAASQLTCTKAGTYYINYFLSFSNMSGNLTKTAIRNNNSVQESTVSRTLPGTAQDFLSGGGIVTVVVGDVIELAISNETDADDPTVDYASVVIARIGD